MKRILGHDKAHFIEYSNRILHSFKLPSGNCKQHSNEISRRSVRLIRAFSKNSLSDPCTPICINL